ncbi:MAG: hypothetical protein IPL32_13170 [Chloracidobacterium sp.]|nr:hypothetical protein [Chloracidobacterium sp.]
MNSSRPAGTLIALLVIVLLEILIARNVMASTQTDIVGPTGSVSFGRFVTALPNGNIVIADPGFTEPGGGPTAVGAVYLYNGATGTMISRITGSTAFDAIGDFGMRIVGNGNFIIRSSGWDNGSATSAGAVTWCSGTIGCTGVVSPANSLVGSTSDDGVYIPTVLANGNYVVVSLSWDNGVVANVGAVTFCDGNTGKFGTITAANSLIGSTLNDRVGSSDSGLLPLLDGPNFLVHSPIWDNGAATNAGAITWCSGTTGCTGVVSAANSLVGSSINDQVGGTGNSTVSRFTNGNYVVRSPNWDAGAITNVGAATFANGATGIAGTISASNSLVGTTASDQVSSGSVTVTSAGKYIVRSPLWDSGVVANTGAVTLGDVATGGSGVVSAANSLIGTTAGDQVGSGSAIFSPSGKYIVSSPNWDNGAIVDVGAVTFLDTSSNLIGVVSAANSLIGTTASDQVGSGGITQPNGNFLVLSPNWDNGLIVDAGAGTFLNASGSLSGTVTAANSLVGTTASDRVGFRGSRTLTNGNYLISSPFWNNGVIADVGAVSFGNGTTGVTGAITASNSYIGGTADDRIGDIFNGVTALANGNYLISSPSWDNGLTANVGALTYGNGSTGSTGLVSTANSLYGTTPDDFINQAVIVLANGNYVVRQPAWDNGAAANAGAVTFGNPAVPLIGPVSAANSLVGTSAGDNLANTSEPVVELSNGAYLINSPSWNNGAIENAGAITIANGTTGISGPVSSANSLVGSTAFDGVGGASFFVSSTFGNGLYPLRSPDWANGAISRAGAITYLDASIGVSGPISSSNSVLGNTANGGSNLSVSFDAVNNQMVVGRSGDRIVTLFRPAGGTTPTPTNTPTNTPTAAGTPSIIGTVTYGNAIGAPTPRFVSNVTITGAGSPTVMTTTAAPGASAGQYTLTGFGAGSYTVTPTKMGGSNSITSFDAARISQHVAGPPNPLLTGNQLVVADVSGNTSVTSFDAAMIAKFAAGPPYEAPGIGSTSTWRFTPTNRNYASVASSISGEDYSALLMGEVSGNWNNTGARPAGTVVSGQWAVDGEDNYRMARPINVTVQEVLTAADKEIVVLVSVEDIADKEVISYEFDLRYDTSVIQPLVEPVDVSGTVSRGLSVVTNAAEPGLLRVVVYGAWPLNENGLLLNLRFTSVGSAGSVSPLSFDRIMFNEGEPRVTITDGKIELF